MLITCRGYGETLPLSTLCGQVGMAEGSEQYPGGRRLGEVSKKQETQRRIYLSGILTAQLDVPWPFADAIRWAWCVALYCSIIFCTSDIDLNRMPTLHGLTCCWYLYVRGIVSTLAHRLMNRFAEITIVSNINDVQARYSPGWGVKCL